MTLATLEMSREELVTLARRYEAMAREAMAEANRRFSVEGHTEPGFEHLDTFEHQMSTNRTIDNETSPQWRDAMPVSVSSSPSLPVADGPFHNKGKGPDPRNWGPVGSLVDVSEQELEAQRDAFHNFAEINRVVKQEKRAESTRVFMFRMWD